MMRVLAVVVVVFAASCGGSPTQPTPAIPAASIVTRGDMSFTACVTGAGCFYQGEAINNGSGCGANVRGVSRLLNAVGTEVGRADWSLTATRKINPSEAFLYDGCCFADAAIAVAATYKTDFSWDTVAC